jgi:hypothetical protein
MTPAIDSQSEGEESPQKEPRQNTDATSAELTNANAEDDAGDEAWCEVSHHKRKKPGAKGGDSGTPMSNNVMEGGKGATRGTGGYNSKYDPRDSPSKKGAKGHGKGGLREFSNSKKDEVQKSPSKEERGSKVPGNAMEGKPLPPWRKQNVGSPQVGSPQAGPTKDPPAEAHSGVRSSPGGGFRASPKSSPSQDSKFKHLLEEAEPDLDLDLPPIAVSFKTLHKSKDSSPTKEHRSNKDDHFSPDKDNSTNKDHGDTPETTKHRVRDEIQEEVNALLDSNDTLCKNDFDGKSRQFLHAIHNINGRQGVHDALHMLDLCTAKKSRDSYRNMSGYVSTLLQKHFQEIGGKQHKDRKDINQLS